MSSLCGTEVLSMLGSEHIHPQPYEYYFKSGKKQVEEK